MKKENLYYLPDDAFIDIFDSDINFYENEYLRRIYNRIKYNKFKQQILNNTPEAVQCI